MLLESKAGYSHSVGLWSQNCPGHTPSVSEGSVTHPGPDAASRLVALSAIGKVDEFLSPVLEGLASLQDRDEESEFFGCFRWYHEEPHIYDTNAAFFIGLNLIVLQKGYYEGLSERDSKCLRGMFEALDVWFDRQVAHATAFYPNKFLGDLVCSWLLKEILQREPGAKLLSVMQESGEYWKTSPWGWGEHLSDPYSTIMLNELSCLLLIARQLPEDLRRLYTDLFHDLLAIDDAYTGGPRVPAIRSYAFTHLIPNAPFRNLVRPAKDWSDTIHNPEQTPHLRMFSFGDFFFRHGWHDLAKAAPPAKNNFTTFCYGGAKATAHVENDFRIGSLSRFPIMPHSDHPQWGLSWQSMPIAFCGEKKNWGFLRWQTREGDIERYHPARDKHHAYLHNALTDSTNPPVLGQTYSLQEALRLVILRQMPRIVRDWQELGDGWDIVEFSGKVTQETVREGDWSRLHLQLEGGRDIALFHFSIDVQCIPSLTQDKNRLSWKVKVQQEELKGQNRFCQIWLIGEPEDPDPILETVPTCQKHPLCEKRTLCWARFSQDIDLEHSESGWTLTVSKEA